MSKCVIHASLILVLIASSVEAARPVPGSCTSPVRSHRQLQTRSLGQDACNDGTLTPVRTSDKIHCDCVRTCDWDDGTQRTTCTRCPENEWIYEDELTDVLCAEHGGVRDSQWYVTSFFAPQGMLDGRNSTITAGTLHGQDLVTCDCLSGKETGCVDAVTGPTIGGMAMGTMCHDVCAWAKGTLATTQYASTDYNSPACAEFVEDRGPEVHCTCGGIPLSETWCSGNPSICEDNGCEVHHTAPNSTRCVPPPSVTPTTSSTTTTLQPNNNCSTRNRPVASALNWLLFATGNEYSCVEALR